MIVLPTFAGLKATYNVLNLKITKKKREVERCCYTSLPIYVTHQNMHGDAYCSARPVYLLLHFVLFIPFDYCIPVSPLPPPILF